MLGLLKRNKSTLIERVAEPKLSLPSVAKKPQTERQNDSAIIIKHHESTHPSIGLTPALAASILLDAERGVLYSDRKSVV